MLRAVLSLVFFVSATFTSDWTFSRLAAEEAAWTLFVAPKNSPAHATANKLAGKEGQVHTKLHKALVEAVQIANQRGQRVVRVLVAAGNYKGKIGQGTWEIPSLNNPRASLEILGGFDPGFQSRKPFTHVVRLLTTPNRANAMMFFGKRGKAQRVVISGFVFDAAASNAYHPKEKSLVRSSSRNYPLLRFNNLLLEELVIADNVFANGSHGAFDPKVIPAIAQTEIRIENNFFINNVKAIKLGAGLSYQGHAISQITVRHNSFLLNWPLNLDIHSANIAAVELQSKETADRILFEKNIFAHNVSGALQHNWIPERMPELSFRDNLFFRNADLFKKTEPDAGVMIGKFGLNPEYIHLDLEEIEDELEYEVKNNSVFNPRFTWDTPADPAQAGKDPAAELLRQLVKGNTNPNTALNTNTPHPSGSQPTESLVPAGFAPRFQWESTRSLLPGNGKATGYGVQLNQTWRKP